MQVASVGTEGEVTTLSVQAFVDLQGGIDGGILIVALRLGGAVVHTAVIDSICPGRVKGHVVFVGVELADSLLRVAVEG